MYRLLRIVAVVLASFVVLSPAGGQSSWGAICNNDGVPFPYFQPDLVSLGNYPSNPYTGLDISGNFAGCSWQLLPLSENVYLTPFSGFTSSPATVVLYRFHTQSNVAQNAEIGLHVVTDQGQTNSIFLDVNLLAGDWLQNNFEWDGDTNDPIVSAGMSFRNIDSNQTYWVDNISIHPLELAIETPTATPTNIFTPTFTPTPLPTDTPGPATVCQITYSFNNDTQGWLPAVVPSPEHQGPLVHNPSVGNTGGPGSLEIVFDPGPGPLGFSYNWGLSRSLDDIMLDFDPTGGTEFIQGLYIISADFKSTNTEQTGMRFWWYRTDIADWEFESTYDPNLADNTWYNLARQHAVNGTEDRIYISLGTGGTGQGPVTANLDHLWMQIPCRTISTPTPTPTPDVATDTPTPTSTSTPIGIATSASPTAEFTPIPTLSPVPSPNPGTPIVEIGEVPAFDDVGTPQPFPVLPPLTLPDTSSVTTCVVPPPLYQVGYWSWLPDNEIPAWPGWTFSIGIYFAWLGEFLFFFLVWILIAFRWLGNALIFIGNFGLLVFYVLLSFGYHIWELFSALFGFSENSLTYVDEAGQLFTITQVEAPATFENYSVPSLVSALAAIVSMPVVGSVLSIIFAVGSLGLWIRIINRFTGGEAA